jgi:CRISPR/Cas system-associated endoribonuclease Cas2
MELERHFNEKLSLCRRLDLSRKENMQVDKIQQSIFHGNLDKGDLQTLSMIVDINKRKERLNLFDRLLEKISIRIQKRIERKLEGALNKQNGE